MANTTSSILPGCKDLEEEFPGVVDRIKENGPILKQATSYLAETVTEAIYVNGTVHFADKNHTG